MRGSARLNFDSLHLNSLTLNPWRKPKSSRYFKIFCFSQHHSLYIISFDLGPLNLKWHNFLGMLVHSWVGVSLGRSLVTGLQDFTGTRSHISSGTSTTFSTTFSRQASTPSAYEQEFPQSVIGSFSHLEKNYLTILTLGNIELFESHFVSERLLSRIDAFSL